MTVTIQSYEGYQRDPILRLVSRFASLRGSYALLIKENEPRKLHETPCKSHKIDPDGTPAACRSTVRKAYGFPLIAPSRTEAEPQEKKIGKPTTERQAFPHCAAASRKEDFTDRQESSSPDPNL